MSIKESVIPVILNIDQDITKRLAKAELEPVWSAKNGSLKLQELAKLGITDVELAKYYTELVEIVSAMCEANRSPESGALDKVKFKPHEIRGLYVPVLFATILSQIGDVKIGNFRVEVKSKIETKVDRKFVLDMSEKLLDVQHILPNENGQIVIGREGNPDVMASVLLSVNANEKAAAVATQDGQNPDDRCKLMAVAAGIQLVNQAHMILFTDHDYVMYGRPGDSIALQNKQSEE